MKRQNMKWKTKQKNQKEMDPQDLISHILVVLAVHDDLHVNVNMHTMFTMLGSFQCKNIL